MVKYFIVYKFNTYNDLGELENEDTKNTVMEYEHEIKDKFDIDTLQEEIYSLRLKFINKYYKGYSISEPVITNFIKL